MKITDINGCQIEVTDLKEAIKIARRYKEYRHEDSNFSELKKKKKTYWSDMYEKLRAIKAQLTTS